MTRRIIELSLATGIAPDVWWRQSWRTIATALDLLDHKNDTDPEGRQMSG